MLYTISPTSQCSYKLFVCAIISDKVTKVSDREDRGLTPLGSEVYLRRETKENVLFYVMHKKCYVAV